jgi:thiamine pyrophosphokinase
VIDHLPHDRLVIAADSGLDHALELGLRVDLLVGDLDSVSERGYAEATSRGTPIERHPADKDATDTELAIAAAVERGCEHLIGVGGPRPDDSRLDHELGVILAFAAPYLAERRVELWWGPARVQVVHGPGSATVEAPARTLVSLLPLHGPAVGVTTSGLRYPLRGEPLLPGSGRGISNEVQGDGGGHGPPPFPPTVRLEAGTLLVVQPLALGDLPCVDT